MSVIRKLESSVAYPINAQSNQIYWNIGQEEGVLDIKSSYVELELQLSNLTGVTGLPSTDAYNVTVGRDGVFYPPSAFVRQCRLADTTNGKVVQDLNYINTLDANLRYFNQGCNEIVADAIFSGAGHRSPDGSIVSVFNNAYPDVNPVVRVPLENVLLGQLGQASALPQGGNMELRWLCEPQQKLFQRSVPSGVYETAEVEPSSFANIAANSDVATALTLGEIAKFRASDIVIVQGTLAGSAYFDTNQVVSVVADAGITAGNLTLDEVIDATNILSNVSIVNGVYNSPLSVLIAANDTGAAVNRNTATLRNTYAIAKSDISVGTAVHVHYKLVNVTNKTISDDIILETTITGLTTSGANITAVQFANNISVPANTNVLFAYIVPLYTNLNADWNIVNSHVVLYRDTMIKANPSEKMLMTSFENQGTQCINGLRSWIYNYQIDNNTQNVYIMTPSATNLYSQIQTYSSYLFSVDDTPLTSIYIPAVHSAVHVENLSKTLQNSMTYKPKNLSSKRDKEVEQVVEPFLFPAKIKESMFKSEALLEAPGKDKNLRVELTSDSGTPAITVYMFAEKWVQL